MAPGSRKKLSLKKKEGGTAVGNALRNAFGKVGGKSQTGAVFNAPLNKGVGFNNQGLVTTTQGGLKTVAKDANKVATTKFGSNPATTVNTNTKGLSFSKNALSNLNLGTQPVTINKSTKGLSFSGGGSSKTTSIADQTALTAGAFGGDINASGYTSGSSGGSNLSSGSSSTPRTSTIGGDVLTSNANSNMFVPEKPIVDYSADIPPTVDLSLQQQEKDIQAEQDKEFKDMIAGLTKDFNNKETGEEIDAKLQKELGIKEKQEEVNTYQTQLNAIVSKGEANQLSLIGQGRGIPEAIIGGQQAQIARETAIAALPVQAQLSAAQGNLEMANDSLDRLFKIYSEDAQNEFEYKREVKKMVYEYADKKTQRKLDEIDKQEERAYSEKQKLIESTQSIAKEAAKNGASAGTLTKIANAKSFAEAISAAGKYMLNTQVVKLDNGNTVVVDSSGKIISNLGGASASGGSGFIVSNDILKNTYGNDVVSLIANTIKSSGAKQSQSTNDAINVISGLQELVKGSPEGVFKGLAPLRLLPGKLKSPEALTNLSNIEAVNLKVQQWASGAALTEQQTKQVEKITPRKGNTDVQIKAKTNALANYMISQVSGQLAGQGIGFAVDKVDLFTKTPEQELKELYQDPTMKQKIQQAVQMFPNYNDAEILQIIQI